MTCLVIAPNIVNSIVNVTLNGSSVEWMNSVKYLGIWICAGKYFHLDLSEVRRKFFMSVNSILSKCKYTNDIVKLQLLESHCLPILLYATECLVLPVSQIKELNSWWNSVYRKIFNYNKWESVKCLIYYLNRLDVHRIINLKQMSFIKRMSSSECSNVTFRNILNNFMNSGKLLTIINKFDCKLNWTVNKIKSNLHLSFKNTLSFNIIVVIRL